MIVTNELYQRTQLRKVVIDVITIEMILYPKHQVEVPSPNSNLFEEFGKGQDLIYAHGLEPLRHVVLEVIAHLLVLI